MLGDGQRRFIGMEKRGGYDVIEVELLDEFGKDGDSKDREYITVIEFVRMEDCRTNQFSWFTLPDFGWWYKRNQNLADISGWLDSEWQKATFKSACALAESKQP